MKQLKEAVAELRKVFDERDHYKKVAESQAIVIALLSKEIKSLTNKK